MAKTIALKIELQLDGGKSIELAATNLKELKDAAKKVKEELSGTDIGSKNFDKLTAASNALNTSIRNLQKGAVDSAAELKELNQSLNAEPKAVGYYRSLQAQLSKLSAQYKDLSRADLEGAFGNELKQKINGINTELKGLDAGLGNFQRNVGNYPTLIGGIGAAFSRLSGFVGAGVAALSGGSKIIEATRQFETLFAVLRQNSDTDLGARQTFEDLTEFAANTPNQLSEVVGAFNKLSSTGIRPTIAELTQLTDLAAAQNKSLDQLSEALIDAQGGEFTRLQEFGVRVKKSGEDLVASFRGQKTVIDNSEEAIRNYVLSLGTLPGVLGTSAVISKTLDGAISNLFDNFDRLAASIGGTEGILQGVVSGFSSLLAAANDLVAVPLSETIAEQRANYAALIGVLQNVTTSENTRRVAIEQLNQNYGEYLGFVVDEKTSQEQLSKALEQGNALFTKRYFLQLQTENRNKFLKQELELEAKISQEVIRQNEIREGAGLTATETIQQATSFITGVDPTIASINNAQEYQRELKKVQAEKERVLKIEEETFRRLGFSNTEQEVFIAGEKAKADARAKSAAADKKANNEALKAAQVGNDVAKKAREEQEKINNLAEGSIARATAELAKLKKELEVTPQNKIEAALENVVSKEAELEVLNGKLDRLRLSLENPLVFSVVENLETNTDTSGVQLFSEKAAKEQAAIAEKVSLDIYEKNEKAAQESIRRRNEFELQAESEKEQKKKEVQDQLKNAGLEIAETAANTLFEIEGIRREQDLQNALTAINTEYDAKIARAQGNKKLIEKLELERVAKIEAAEKKAAQQRQKAARKEALILGALAILKAFATLDPISAAIQSAIIAAQTIAQIAVINAQQFAKGGRVKKLGDGIIREKANAPKTAKGDDVLAYLSAGEMVLNRRQQRKAERKFGKNIWGELGVTGFSRSGLPTYKAPSVRSFVRGYADGGRVGSVPISLTIPEEQMEQFAGMVAQQVGFATNEAVISGVIEANRQNQITNEFNSRIA